MKKVSLFLFILVFPVTFLGCTTEPSESTLLPDLSEAGFIVTDGINLGNGNYENQLLYYNNQYSSINVSFDNIYTFEDGSSLDYGYIYELNDLTQTSTFFANREEYSMTVNDIVFIYSVDNYVLEVYHATKSTFPGFLRHYSFEASFQYFLFYTDDLVYPPIITAFLENGATVSYTYTETELLENGFSDYNIPYRKAYRIIDENIGTSVLVIEVNSIEDAILLYENQANRFFPASAFSQMVVRYQNMVFKMAYPHYTQSKVLSAIMGDATYDMYDETDIINP